MINEAGQDFIDTKLKQALETESEAIADRHFTGLFAILDYAMISGELSPSEFVEQRRLVELTKHRRGYR